MRRSSNLVVSSVLALLASCGEDPTVEPHDGACPISERAKLAAPPEGWVAEEHGVYAFHVFDEIVLYSFDDENDPDRLYWRLDRCTGAIAPFPALRQGMYGPYVRDTPVGRVLYAQAGGAHYVVDRLDVPGDDEPRALAGLPPEGFFELHFWERDAVPYAFFDRDDELYTHTGDAGAPVKRVAQNVEWSVPYANAILIFSEGGELRAVDPFTGDSDLVLGGVDAAFPLARGSAPEEMVLLWQPAGDPGVYVRRLAAERDVRLDLGSAMLGYVAWWSEDGMLVGFEEADAPNGTTRFEAVVRTDTGAGLSVPEHVDIIYVSDRALGLVLSDSEEVVAAMWEPLTGALHEWYRGPGPVPRVKAYDGASVYYFVAEPDVDPPVGGLWHVDLASGKRRLALGRIEPDAEWIDPRKLLVRFGQGPSVGLGWADQLYDFKIADVETGLYTPIAENVSGDVIVDGEGIIYLDAHGPEPGLWAIPVP